MTELSARSVQLLGRIYFVAIIPFFGGAIAPWILGPAATTAAAEFLLWSFVVLIFCSAGWLGFKIGAGERFVALQLFVSMTLCAVAVGAYLTARGKTPFIAVALFTFLYWTHLLWVQKTSHLCRELLKQHQRFIWTALACHMVVLLNLIYLVKIR
jgi:hypothetical protein